MSQGLVVVCYDVRDDRRRLRVSRVLEGHGERVQESVFECWLGPDQLERLQDALSREVDGVDSVAYFRLCAKDAQSVRVLGIGAPPSRPDYRIA